MNKKQLINNHIVETLKHKDKVGFLIHSIIEELLFRAKMHDNTKLESPECDIFAEVTPRLKTLTYGSEEYKECLKEIEPAIKHHYSFNSHHPEHYKDGIAGMNLIDLVEMFCDWWAASKRHEDGDIRKSIEINTKRFNMPEELTKIFHNTVDELNKLQKGLDD